MSYNPTKLGTATIALPDVRQLFCCVSAPAPLDPLLFPPTPNTLPAFPPFSLQDLVGAPPTPRAAHSVALPHDPGLPNGDALHGAAHGSDSFWRLASAGRRRSMPVTDGMMVVGTGGGSEPWTAAHTATGSPRGAAAMAAKAPGATPRIGRWSSVPSFRPFLYGRTQPMGGFAAAAAAAAAAAGGGVGAGRAMSGTLPDGARATRETHARSPVGHLSFSLGPSSLSGQLPPPPLLPGHAPQLPPTALQASPSSRKQSASGCLAAPPLGTQCPTESGAAEAPPSLMQWQQQQQQQRQQQQVAQGGGSGGRSGCLLPPQGLAPPPSWPRLPSSALIGEGVAASGAAHAHAHVYHMGMGFGCKCVHVCTCDHVFAHVQARACAHAAKAHSRRTSCCAVSPSPPPSSSMSACLQSADPFMQQLRNWC